jgi:peptide/nickel transport system substrate-binding protein
MVDLDKNGSAEIVDLLNLGSGISRRRVLQGGLAAGAIALGGSKVAFAAEGRTLSVLTVAVAASLDRDSSQASSSGLTETSLNCTDPLVGFKLDRQGPITLRDLGGLPNSLQPRLALSWEKVGDLKWRFKLRQGVVNHLGHEFTADDVVWSFARSKSRSGQVTASAYVATTGGIFAEDAKDTVLKNEVVAVDKYTVEFNLAANTGLFPTVLAIWSQYILDSTEYKKHATADDPWAHKWGNEGYIAGFGPYYVEKLTPNAAMTLKATPNYYGDAPVFTTINITASTNPSAMLAAIQSGSVDFVEGLSPQAIKTLENSTAAQSVGGYTNKIMELFLNYNDAPWNGPKAKFIRQAVAYALPYDDILKSVYPGISRRARSHVPSTFRGYVAVNTYETNVAKAKELMVQAGYPNGQGLKADMPGLQLHYPDNIPDMASVAIYVRSALAAIGIPLTLQPITPAVFSTRKLVKRDLPMVLDPSDNPNIPDALYMVQTFFVPKSAGGLIDEGNYNNETVNKLTSAGFTQTGSERDTAAAEIQKIMMEELPAVPIAEVEAYAVAKKGINGYVPQDALNVTQFQYLY